MTNVLVRYVCAGVLAVTWIIIWQQLLFASSLPGEGFSASVLLLLVVMLQYVVLGGRLARRRWPPAAFRLALLAGLVLLVGLVAGPMLAGAAPLTAFKLPLGPYRLASTLLFDVAVFLVVSGGMLTALSQLAESPP